MSFEKIWIFHDILLLWLLYSVFIFGWKTKTTQQNVTLLFIVSKRIFHMKKRENFCFPQNPTLWIDFALKKLVRLVVWFCHFLKDDIFRRKVFIWSNATSLKELVQGARKLGGEIRYDGGFEYNGTPWFLG